MSVKLCLRLIPSIVRQANCNKVVAQDSLLRCRSGITKLNLENLCVRLASNVTSKPREIDANKPIQVYYGILAPQMRAVKIFSLLTSVTGIVAQPVLYKYIVATDNLPVIIGLCSFVGFFTMITPILLHLVTKKYVTQLMYNPQSETYIATTLNLLNLPREIEFKPDDVRVPDVPGMFTSMEVKGVPLFLDPRLFEDPAHYGKIMGYDKPLDLKLYNDYFREKKK